MHIVPQAGYILISGECFCFFYQAVQFLDGSVVLDFQIFLCVQKGFQSLVHSDLIFLAQFFVGQYSFGVIQSFLQLLNAQIGVSAQIQFLNSGDFFFQSCFVSLYQQGVHSVLQGLRSGFHFFIGSRTVFQYLLGVVQSSLQIIPQAGYILICGECFCLFYQEFQSILRAVYCAQSPHAFGQLFPSSVGRFLGSIRIFQNLLGLGQCLFQAFLIGLGSFIGV